MADPKTVSPPTSATQSAPITRKVFVGHTINDVYVRKGKHYGPGVAEFPYNTDEEVADFNDFVACVKRVQASREPEHRVNLDAIDTPLPKQLSQATAEELRAQLLALGHPVELNPGASVEPVAATPVPLPITPIATQFTPTGGAPAAPITPIAPKP